MIKKITNRVTLLFICIFPLYGISQSYDFSPFPDDDSLANEMEDYLILNLLNKWYPTIIDHENGGFFTNFSATWQPLSPHPKMIVTQARDMWTACKAAERYPDESRYLDAANHGFQFLKDKMWDDEYGGFKTYVDGNSDNSGKSMKTAYGNAFAIYALAAYTKLTDSSESLNLAKKAFYWLEKHSHDAKYGGYYDHITREGISYNSDNFNNTTFPAGMRDAKWKDYNASIHLMEAFTELYQVWPDSLVRLRLQEMFHLIRDTFVTNKGFMNLYFEADWTHVSFRNHKKSEILNNLYYDHVTFGHDIETAFLLREAAHVLAIENDSITNSVTKKLVDHTLTWGFDKDFTGIFEAGYYYSLDEPIQIIKDTKTWWAQAEGLNALLLYSRLYPQEQKYKYAFHRLWQYIKICIIDQKNGDWYSQGIDKEPESKNSRKAYEWKSCYHNGRALMNCIDMLRTK